MVIKFIEDTLFCTSPHALSYSDPDKKWIIRNHLISLFQDYPSLKPSVDFFIHNDGTEVKLFRINGELSVSSNMASVPLIIWLHELYPQMPPTVYVSSINPISENHPFVDSSSGATTSSYLKNWQFNKSNLLDLVRNLKKLFSLNHPFYYSGSSSCSHPSMISKTEAMDRLACTIYYDMMDIRFKNEEEIGKMVALQTKLEKRAETVRILEFGLDHERKILNNRIEKLSHESDKLLNWLKVYDKSSFSSMLGGQIENAFKALDEKSEILLDLMASDNAIEDLMYNLEEAVEKGVVNFQVYIKQVRLLAREQFMHRAKIVKFEK